MNTTKCAKALCVAWVIISFFIVLWEFNIINEKSAEIEKLNLRPNEITTCVEDGNQFHTIHVKFNDDTTRKGKKYGLTSYAHIIFKNDHCHVLHTHLNYIDPYDAHFGIDDFDNEVCEKIKRRAKSNCDVKY